jgi:hypothetical protein
MKAPNLKAPDGKLYGLERSNRKPEDFWGKNQFNSTFPIALCCYMRDKGIKPVYLTLDDDLKIVPVHNKIGFEDVFGTKNRDVHFSFEDDFKEYRKYLHDELDNTDLITSYENKELNHLEIKQTVLPDTSTNRLEEEHWGCEIVFRPNSFIYACLSAYTRLAKERTKILKTLKPLLVFDDWENKTELISKHKLILNWLGYFLVTFKSYQKPFVIQQVWKTEGQSPHLAERCFDVFIWSDFASLAIPFIKTVDRKKEQASRYFRACARIVRCLCELFRSGTIRSDLIFHKMDLGLQTDKEFSINGNFTSGILQASPRFLSPVLGSTVLKEIILEDGQLNLQPERRFDATVSFACSHLFSK